MSQVAAGGRHWRWLGLVATLVMGGCSGPQSSEEIVANPVRARLEAAIARLPPDQPLQLRYNPAACDCPAFEMRLAKRWVRAVWVNAAEPRYKRLMSALVASAPNEWPQAVLAKAQVDPEIVRAVQGTYAVRLQVIEIIGPSDRPQGANKEPPTTSPPGETTAANDRDSSDRDNDAGKKGEAKKGEAKKGEAKTKAPSNSAVRDRPKKVQ